MGLSLTHLLLVLVVVLVLFGAGKLPNVMGDIGKGIRNFKAGLNTDENKPPKVDANEPPRIPPHDPQA